MVCVLRSNWGQIIEGWEQLGVSDWPITFFWRGDDMRFIEFSIGGGVMSGDVAFRVHRVDCEPSPELYVLDCSFSWRLFASFLIIIIVFFNHLWLLIIRGILLNQWVIFLDIEVLVVSLRYILVYWLLCHHRLLVVLSPIKFGNN